METLFVHRGIIRDDLVPVFDEPEFWRNNRIQMRGKRFELILREEFAKKTKGQLGFLFKAVIRGECVNSEYFFGWSEKKILEHLEGELSTYLFSYFDINGVERKKEVILTLHSMNKKQTTIFIEKVLVYLSELGIEIKDEKNYG